MGGWGCLCVSARAEGEDTMGWRGTAGGSTTRRSSCPLTCATPTCPPCPTRRAAARPCASRPSWPTQTVCRYAFAFAGICISEYAGGGGGRGGGDDNDGASSVRSGVAVAALRARSSAAAAVAPPRETRGLRKLVRARDTRTAFPYPPHSTIPYPPPHSTIRGPHFRIWLSRVDRQFGICISRVDRQFDICKPQCVS